MTSHWTLLLVGLILVSAVVALAVLSLYLVLAIRRAIGTRDTRTLAQILRAALLWLGVALIFALYAFLFGVSPREAVTTPIFLLGSVLFGVGWAFVTLKATQGFADWFEPERKEARPADHGIDQVGRRPHWQMMGQPLLGLLTVFLFFLWVFPRLTSVQAGIFLGYSLLMIPFHELVHLVAFAPLGARPRIGWFRDTMQDIFGIGIVPSEAISFRKSLFAKLLPLPAVPLAFVLLLVYGFPYSVVVIGVLLSFFLSWFDIATLVGYDQWRAEKKDG